MAVSLPISPGVKMAAGATGAPSPVRPGVSAPSVGLPLSFVLTGLAALCFGVSWLIFRPSLLASYHYNQYVIAATHLFVLGWIGSIVMGAMYQLVPVALETRLYSERLARWQFAFHCLGFSGMVYMFNTWNMRQVGHFGCVLALGIGLFVYNLLQTLRRVPKWNVTAMAVAAALGWLSLAICAGLSIATAKCLNEFESGPATAGIVAGLRSLAEFTAHFAPISAMHAHAHLGALGCFLLLIVGVSYKLIPMFTLSEIQSRRRAIASIALLNLGLAGAFITILTGNRWKLAFTLLVIVGLGLFGWEVLAILRTRKRRTLDWGLKSFLTALGLLLPLCGIAVVLSWPGLPLNSFTGQLENLYGFIGFIGVISFAIIGMLYKIVPFLIWFKSYSTQIGRARVPGLADLYSSRWQAVGYWTYLAGLAITTPAILGSSAAGVRIGCGLLGMSLATLLFNVGVMLTHFCKPKLNPLNSSNSAAFKLA